MTAYTPLTKKELLQDLESLAGYGAQDLLPKAQKTGWLTKRGGRFKTWKKRFFILIQHNLFYYVKDTDKHPKGLIDLVGVSVRDDLETGVKFGFQIYAPGQEMSDTHDSYYIHGATEDEARTWVEAIRKNTVHGYNPGGIGQSSAIVDTRIDHEKTKVFGSPLENMTSRADPLPPIVAKCIAALTEGRGADGLKAEGIFRLSGGAAEISAFRAAFDRGEDVNVKEAEDPHVIAGLLKLYLRELPDPVFTFAMYQEWLTAVRLPWDQRLAEFKALLLRLPPPNRAVIRALASFIPKVAALEKYNKMSLSNLATVFGPNMLRPQDEGNPLEALANTPLVIEVITTCVLGREFLFKGGPDPSKAGAKGGGGTVGKKGGDKASPNTENAGKKARVLYDYSGTTDKELSAKAGDVVVIQSQTGGANGGWSLVKNADGKEGHFPGSYLKIIDADGGSTGGRSHGGAVVGMVNDKPLCNRYGGTLNATLKSFMEVKGVSSRAPLEELVERLVLEVQELKSSLHAHRTARRELEARLSKK